MSADSQQQQQQQQSSSSSTLAISQLWQDFVSNASLSNNFCATTSSTNANATANNNNNITTISGVNNIATATSKKTLLNGNNSATNTGNKQKFNKSVRSGVGSAVGKSGENINFDAANLFNSSSGAFGDAFNSINLNNILSLTTDDNNLQMSDNNFNVNTFNNNNNNNSINNNSTTNNIQNNSNYINFNQFIMQHNFFGSSSNQLLNSNHNNNMSNNNGATINLNTNNHISTVGNSFGIGINIVNDVGPGYYGLGSSSTLLTGGADSTVYPAIPPAPAAPTTPSPYATAAQQQGYLWNNIPPGRISGYGDELFGFQPLPEAHKINNFLDDYRQNVVAVQQANLFPYNNGIATDLPPPSNANATFNNIFSNDVNNSSNNIDGINNGTTTSIKTNTSGAGGDNTLNGLEISNGMNYHNNTRNEVSENINSNVSTNDDAGFGAGDGKKTATMLPNTYEYETLYTPFGHNILKNSFVKKEAITSTISNNNNFNVNSSNLHASAQEFIPSVKNLSINDNDEKYKTIKNHNYNNVKNESITLTNKKSEEKLPSKINDFAAGKAGARKPLEKYSFVAAAANDVKKTTNTTAVSAITGSQDATATITSASSSSPTIVSSNSGVGGCFVPRSTGATSKITTRNKDNHLCGNINGIKNQGGSSKIANSISNEKNDKLNHARAERERERDSRRYQQTNNMNGTGSGNGYSAGYNNNSANNNNNNNNNGGGRRSVDFLEREERYDRYDRDRSDRLDRNERDRTDRLDRNDRDRSDRLDRNDRDRSDRLDRNERDRSDRLDRNERDRLDRNERDRSDRLDRNERTNGGNGNTNGSNHRNNNHQRYDNHRSNKRRDDWNRNRDRINGFRVEEKYSSDNGKDSPLPSPEKKLSPKKIYPENEKLSQREKLIRDIETRRLECLVCVEPIKAYHGVWSCNNCYHILHLQCITKWAFSSKSNDGWRCPACQNVVKEVPHDYYCFCGKIKNPPYSRQDIAHSCGEICSRIEGCTHACTLLCHPGPCPPCQANVKRTCGCGKTTKLMQCCLKEAIECDATCGKLLNCELHKCQEKCHEGKCIVCSEKVDQHCHCSKQERQVACTRDSQDKHSYSCGKPCGKDLTCGNHKCKDCCHAGECRLCKSSPGTVATCPCGKMPIPEGQRASCLDPIPVCEGICAKTLRCGKAAHPHHCTSKCHLGNCPPCNKQTAVKCRCGHMDQMIKCRQLSTRADDARCKKRCVKKRSCGKHKCNQECCIDIDHICPLPCNYTLSCGKHKCDQPCHRGNCPPCYRSSFEELFCECGAEVIYPPVPCGTKRPICKRPCSRTHPCDHTPQHNCHSAATCPPCMMFTTKWCFGQHEQRKTIPCSQESFSCGLPCNKPLPCGRHKCIKSCHESACQQTGEICKQSCTKLRTTCGHKCMAPCHEADCPETPCKEMVEVQCECGNRKQMRACYDLAREYSRIATAQLASSMAEMQRGNYMELSEILAPVKINKTNKTLDCNEECRLVERNRRLTIGLQTRNPELPSKIMTRYSEFIRNFAKRDPTLVKTIYDALTNLVKLAKESKQKSRSHSFPTMNREKRQLVHELCEMFGVESVAYDAEPNRNVVATAHKDRSWLPATSIMDVMQRESGQRRVPVPSNNAWGIKR